MKHLVIIGNSAAAVGCIEGFRSADGSSRITVLSQEPHHTYSRPLISYLLYGKTDRQRMKYRPDDFYARNRVAFRGGCTAVSVDPQARQVTLADGSCIGYDELLVATGSRPFVPPTEGLDKVENAFTFMTLDDALALEKALTPDSRVLIVGAGLIGLKCAEGIRGRIRALTVVDMADHILPSILDAGSAAPVQRHLERQGIRFFLGDRVARYENGRAVLDSGAAVDFDILVTAVGVRPNTALVEQAGGAVDRGIVTDEFCRTTLPHIYAAGDCTTSRDVVSGERRVLALLPNAYLQGEAAGLHMAGVEKPYDHAAAMNAIGFFGLHILTAGNAAGEVLDYSDETNIRKFFLKDGCLNGYIIVGDVRRAGIYTALIRNRTPLDGLDRRHLFPQPQLMAFPRASRDAVLARSH